MASVLLGGWGHGSGTVSLSWDANSEADLSGYRVHYGPVSSGYTESVDVGNSTSTTVSGLLPGSTYYFAVAAYNTMGQASDYSNEVSTDVALSVPAHRESGGQVSLEAENYSSVLAGRDAAAAQSWSLSTQVSGYSGSGAMAALPNSGVNVKDSLIGPRLDYTIDFQTPGTYYAWIRIFAASGSDDSIHVGLNGQPVSFGGIGVYAVSGSWTWVGEFAAAPIKIEVGSAGIHTFSIWMREDGVVVDKLLLTMDANYVPTGLGLDENSGIEENQMPVAVDDTATTPEGVAVEIPVLANDTDADGDALVVSVVGSPAHGSAVIAGGGTTVLYTPASGFVGTDSFTYTVSDGKGGEATGTVTVEVISTQNVDGGSSIDGGFAEQSGLVVVEAENRTNSVAGTGKASGQAWLEATAASGYSGAGYMVSSPNNQVNLRDSLDGPRLDFDVQFSTVGTWYVWVRIFGDHGTNDSVHAGLNGQAATLGGLGMSDASGSWTWVGATDQARVKVEVAAAGTHTVNIWMREDGVAVDKVILTMDAGLVPEGLGVDETRSGASSNQLPVAVDDFVTVIEGGSIDIAVTANDTDADGDLLVVISASSASHGAVEVIDSGTVRYTPVPGYFGTDTFMYTISDGKGGEASAVVEVTVVADVSPIEVIWALPIVVVQGTATAELEIGLAETATDGVDEGLDQVMWETAADFAGIEVKDQPGLYLRKDYRDALAERLNWIVSIDQAQAGLVKLSWDPALIPVEAVLTLAELDANGAVVAESMVDMSGTGQAELAIPAGGARYRVSYVSLLPTHETVAIKAGWNLVSFSLLPTDNQVGTVFAGIDTSAVYEYDKASERYVWVNTVLPGVGYWLNSRQAGTATNYGVPATAAALPLEPGWNLVGPLAPCPVPDNPAIDPMSVWTYSDTGDYETAAELKPGKAYWIYAYEATLLVLE